MSKLHVALAVISLALAAAHGGWSFLLMASASASLAVVFADNGDDD